MVEAIVDRGVDAAATLAAIATPLPAIRKISEVAKDFFEDVVRDEDDAFSPDAVEAARRVADVLEILLILAQRVDAVNDRVVAAMRDLERLLGAFIASALRRRSSAVAWKLRKFAGALSRRDKKIRDTLEWLARVYGLDLQLGPPPREYRLEAALRRFAGARDDDELAYETAVAPATGGGIKDHRMPEEEEEEDASWRANVEFLKRALERDDLAAVVAAGKKASRVVASTALSFESALVVQLSAASFADDATNIETLLEEAPFVVDEPLGGGGAWALSAIHVAAMRGNIASVEMLATSKADLSIRDKRKRTPLHHAAARGRADAVAYLLSRGVDVDAADGRGWTPLSLASFEGFFDVVACLVEMGNADVNHTGVDDETALDLCRGHEQIAAYLEARHGRRRRPRGPPLRRLEPAFIAREEEEEEEEEDVSRRRCWELLYERRTFGMFEVVDVVARGTSSFGEVYVARSKRSIRAMRRVRSHNVRACREALMMAQLGAHPCVVSLRYCIASTDGLLLFSTLVEGARTLARLVSSGDLYDADFSILSILERLASALAFCHSRGVLHQNMTLESVLIDTAGNAFLAGFELARRGQGRDQHLRAPLSPGCAYASPQVRAALESLMMCHQTSPEAVPIVSPAETDVWAFGVLGLRSYAARDDLMVLATTDHLLETVLQPSDETPDNFSEDAASCESSDGTLEDNRFSRRRLLVPPAATNLLQRCLAVDVTHRPPCGAALLDAMVTKGATAAASPAGDASSSTFCEEEEEEEEAEMVLNIGRAAVELRDDAAGLAREALEAAADRGADVSECYALLACARVLAGASEEAIEASNKALDHDPAHGGALFVKAEATYRRDRHASSALFVDVLRLARVSPRLLEKPHIDVQEKRGDAAYLEAARAEADSARDPITNDRVSVSARVRELPPNIMHRSDIAFCRRRRRRVPNATTTAAVRDLVRAALGDVLRHASRGLLEAAARAGRVVVEGGAGSGKGWTLRALVVALCARQIDSKKRQQQFLLPLTIALSSIEEDPSSDWLARAIDNARDGDALRSARLDRRLVLCLDGLDEVAPATRQSLVEKILEFTSRSCALTVVASRPSASNIRDLAPHGFVFLTIRPIKAPNNNNNNDDVVVETPLCLRLATTLVPRSRFARRDEVLLRRVADEVLEARAVAPGHRDGALEVARDAVRDCGALAVGKILERLAFAAHADRRLILGRTDFENLQAPRLAAAIWSLARSGLLPPLEPRADGAVAFFHRSIQEFYAARALLGVSDGLLDKRLVEEEDDDDDLWWQSVFLVAFQLAEPRFREVALAALAAKIPDLRPGETVEACLEDDQGRERYARSEVASVESSSEIRLKHSSFWDLAPPVVISVERVRRDVAGVAAFARFAAAEGATSIVGGLIRHGADLVTPVDSTTKETALHAAARRGRSECARILLAAGASPRATNRFGMTPRDLGLSSVLSDRDRAEMVRVFSPPNCDEELAALPLDSRVIKWLDNEEEEEEGSSEEDNNESWDDAKVRAYAFAHACQRGKRVVAAKLAASIDDVNAYFLPGGASVPLHFAVVNSCADAASKLLERGARLLDDDGKGESALALASRLDRTEELSLILRRRLKHGGGEEATMLLGHALLPAARFGFVACARLLIARGARVDEVKTDRGATPLFLASQNGHLECVRLLISKGAVLDQPLKNDDDDDDDDDQGATPLCLASQNGHDDCVRLLIDEGAVVDRVFSSCGETPLHVASLNGHLECVRLLIDNGAKVNKKRTDNGSTPLHVASWNGHAACAQLLIEKGAEVNEARRHHRDENGDATPLHLACEHGHVECARLLIDEGADVRTAWTSSGVTPLHVASQNGHVECARLLIERGGAGVVDRGRTDIDATPLHVASQNGHVECARLLIEKGAAVDKATTDGGWTPLHLASQNGNVDCVQLLIDEGGAKVEKSPGEIGANPLHAASQNGHVECARLLIEKGAADVDKAWPDDVGATPLHVASQHGRVECARLLLEKGARVDKKRKKDGATPLFVASQSGQVECARLLIEKEEEEGGGGGGVDAACAGTTPLFVASQNGHVECARLLIEKGAEVDKVQTKDGETSLHVAARNGHVECVHLLIQNGARVDKAWTDAGWTPLHLASQNGRVRCARLLIKRGADVHKALIDGGGGGWTPLHLAAQNGHVDCVHVLIGNGGADVDRPRTKDGSTPLHLASRNGYDRCVEYLIQKGADVDLATTTNVGWTPLLLASQDSHLGCVGLLLEKGARVDKPRADNGWTPLHLASQRCHVDCARLLITKGRANVNAASSDDGSAPLFMASQMGHVECARLLIDNRAEIDHVRTKDGATALYVASQRGRLECVSLLIEKGARVAKKRAIDGATSLHAACQNGHVACAQTLIKKGAVVGVTTTDGGWTPLHLASENNQIDCARLLIRKGALVDRASTDGLWTPLHLASQNGHVESARLLIERGAKVNEGRAKDGATALHLASQNGHVACMQLLIENGAAVDDALTTTTTTTTTTNGENYSDYELHRHRRHLGNDNNNNGRHHDHYVECARERGEQAPPLEKEKEEQQPRGSRTDDKTRIISGGATPLHLASQRGHVECARLLLEKGAVVDKATTSGGWTPLHLASQNGHVECARLLIEKCGASKETSSDDGSKPLHLASQKGHVEIVRMLIKMGVEVDAALPGDGSTPLHLASQRGRVECLPILIDEGGARVDGPRTKDGATPLHLASQCGHVECARMLIERGAEADNATPDGGWTPLHLAAQKSHVECLQLLVVEKGVDVDKASTRGGWTPLHLASQSGHVESARLLIEMGADVERASSDDGLAPLHVASRHGRAECVALLIEKGANVDKPRTGSGNTTTIGTTIGTTTPLHAASQNGHVECVKVLIEKGANVEIAADNGSTPLFLASQNGHLECARLLIELGACEVDPQTSNNDGTTPLHAATLNAHVECAELLLEKGARVDKARAKDGWTPLHVASEQGHVECARLLIEKGADVALVTTSGSWTPLLLASENGHLGCLKLLIEKGADVDKARTNSGWTPLHLASHNGHFACVRHLIEKGVDVDEAMTGSGATPLHLACQNGYVDCVRLFIKNAAQIDKARTKDGATPLHIAARNGHLDCLRLLIAKGADVRAKTHQRRTPRDIATSGEVKESLLEAEALSRSSCRCVSW